MSIGETVPERDLWGLSGKDALGFLQGIVTNDLSPLEQGPGIVWCGLLSPQGKYLADFFVIRLGDRRLLIDIARALAADTLRRLTMYRLRADVQIAPSPLHVLRGLGPAPQGALRDPRHPDLGWRAWSDTPGDAPAIDWDAIRLDHLIPESGIELCPDETYILEAGFERLHGVDFRKGCYVGQEVTARMKHKTDLRRGLVRLALDQPVPVGTEVLADGKVAGRVFTQGQGRALAVMRLDQLSQNLTAGAAQVTPD